MKTPQKIFFKKLKKNVTQNQIQDYTDNNRKVRQFRHNKLSHEFLVTTFYNHILSKFLKQI